MTTRDDDDGRVPVDSARIEAAAEHLGAYAADPCPGDDLREVLLAVAACIREAGAAAAVDAGRYNKVRPSFARVLEAVEAL